MSKEPRTKRQLASDKRFSARMQRQPAVDNRRTAKQLAKDKSFGAMVSARAKERGPRMMKGKLPTEPHTVVFEGKEMAGGTWSLYRITPDPEKPSRWPAYKLTAEKKANKANYELTWHVIEHRLVRKKDMVPLAEHAPEVYAYVASVIEELQPQQKE